MTYRTNSLSVLVLPQRTPRSIVSSWGRVVYKASENGGCSKLWPKTGNTFVESQAKCIANCSKSWKIDFSAIGRGSWWFTCALYGVRSVICDRSSLAFGIRRASYSLYAYHVPTISVRHQQRLKTTARWTLCHTNTIVCTSFSRRRYARLTDPRDTRLSQMLNTVTSVATRRPKI